MQISLVCTAEATQWCNRSLVHFPWHKPDGAYSGVVGTVVSMVLEDDLSGTLTSLQGVYMFLFLANCFAVTSGLWVQIACNMIGDIIPCSQTIFSCLRSY